MYGEVWQAVERALGSRLNPEEKQLLVDERDAEEVRLFLAGEGWDGEDSVAAVAEKVRRMRRAYQGSTAAAPSPPAPRTRRTRNIATRQYVLSYLLAQEASGRDDVRRVREDILGGRLVGVEELAFWGRDASGKLTGECAAEVPPGTTVSLAPDRSLSFNPPLELDGTIELDDAAPQRALRSRLAAAGEAAQEAEYVSRTEKLSVLADSLAEQYLWTALQAAAFVVSDFVPLVFLYFVGAVIDLAEKHRTRLTLTFDLALSPDEVKVIYQDYRTRLLGGRPELPVRKHLELVLFATRGRAQGQPWEEIRKAWNQEFGDRYPGWSYADRRNLQRDYGEAKKRVLAMGGVTKPKDPW